jgi:hypothetical protein
LIDYCDFLLDLIIVVQSAVARKQSTGLLEKELAATTNRICQGTM